MCYILIILAATKLTSKDGDVMINDVLLIFLVLIVVIHKSLVVAITLLEVG